MKQLENDFEFGTFSHKLAKFVAVIHFVQFVGCTSMSEAFHRLDLARAVSDVRRFNYICKVSFQY